MESVDAGLDSAAGRGADAERALGPRHGVRPRPRDDCACGRQGLPNLPRPGRPVGLGYNRGGVEAAPHRQRTQFATEAHVRLAGRRPCGKPPRSVGRCGLLPGVSILYHAIRTNLPGVCLGGPLGTATRHRDVHQPHAAAQRSEQSSRSRHRVLPRQWQDLRVRRLQRQVFDAGRPVGMGREFLVSGAK